MVILLPRQTLLRMLRLVEIRPLITGKRGSVCTSRTGSGLGHPLPLSASRLDPFFSEGDVHMRTIGIDLSAKGEHKAVVVDETGRFVSPVLRFRTEPASMSRLLEVAQEGNADGQLQAVMETTGMAWFP